MVAGTVVSSEPAAATVVFVHRLDRQNQEIQTSNNKTGGKKVRKHRGVTQTGGNAGRLRKGYRYSGKKLKSGLPQIIKCKSKKC